MRLRDLVCVVSIAATSCSELSTIELDTCGNGLVEPDQREDCDTAVDPELGDNLSCGEPMDPIRRCRYVCGRTVGAPQCPVGWTCDEGGICVFASGRYEAIGSGQLSGPAIGLAARDFDGDGRADVAALTAAGLSFRYSDPGGLPTSGGEIPFDVSGSPIVSFNDLNSDGRADVAVPLQHGLLVLLGTPDRRLQLVPYPNTTNVPGNTNLIPLRLPGFPLLLGGVVQLPGQICLPTPCRDCSDPRARADFDISIDTSQYDLLLAPGDTPSILIAVQGAMEVDVFTASSTAAPSCVYDTFLSQRVPLPLPAKKGLRFADVDGDGDRDLLIRGDGVVMLSERRDGSWMPAAVEPRFDVIARAGAPDGWPLAAADLDGDMRADFVVNHGAYLTTDTGVMHVLNSDRPWSLALITDLNRDGRNDIVTAQEGLPRLDVLTNAGNGIFNPANITTAAPIRSMTTGDFDGDLVPDVAFVQEEFRNVANGGTSMAVVFGTHLGPPSPPSPMGRVDFLSNLRPFDLPRIPFPDAIDDLFGEITANSDGTGIRSYAFFAGNATRRVATVLAPPVSAQEDIRTNQAFGTLSGEFDGQPGTDLFLGRTRDLWLMPGDGNARFQSERMLPIDLASMCGEDAALMGFDCITATTGRLRPTDPGDTVVIVNECTERLMVLTPTCEIIDLGDTPPVQSVFMANFDNRDASEIVIVFQPTPGAPNLVLASVAEDNTISTAPVTVGDGGAIDAIALNVDADRDLELLVLTPTGLVVGNIDPTGFIPRDVVFEREVTGKARLAAADIDGDGLQDLIVSEGARYFLFRAISGQGR